MGKRIIAQRRGRGGRQYRALKKRKLAPARYPEVSSKLVRGEVKDILHEIGRNTPLAKVKFEKENFSYIPAITGLRVGAMIEIGKGSQLKEGNVLPLSEMPEGSIICNIELNQGDGGKLVKTPGGSATLFSHTPSGALIRFPSGKAAIINSNSRASMGRIAGWGRSEKPFLKAGNKHHLMRSKNKTYPKVRGVAMASVHHPFGGGRHQHPGKPTTTSRNAPPGRKVGLIAAKKTGTKRLARAKIEVKR
jgi:large subunit ribosomal protein L2|tara:strand:+ start:356 stop:1099 length:744 start_codon:yes stop_codon:yes gene_type:complete